MKISWATLMSAFSGYGPDPHEFYRVEFRPERLQERLDDYGELREQEARREEAAVARDDQGQHRDHVAGGRSVPASPLAQALSAAEADPQAEAVRVIVPADLYQAGYADETERVRYGRVVAARLAELGVTVTGVPSADPVREKYYCGRHRL